MFISVTVPAELVIVIAPLPVANCRHVCPPLVTVKLGIAGGGNSGCADVTT